MVPAARPVRRQMRRQWRSLGTASARRSRAGRRRAHATYHASHGTDETTSLSYAMDLTPLLADPGLSPWAYVSGFIDRFASDVGGRLARLQGEEGSK